MKRMILSTALAAMTLSAVAQDDLYFNPKEEPKAVEHSAAPKHPHMRPGEDPWHGGCKRDIDEYNRRGPLHSRVEKIGTDSLGSDIIQFQVGDGTYPDFTPADTLDPLMQVYPEDDSDYECSRRISRWDDWYGPYDLWYASRWGWGWPYRYGYWGWYDPWYADLYWGGYYGWYDPWFYGYRHWGYPYWGGGYHRGGITGTMNHGVPTRRGTGSTLGSLGGRRPAANGTTNGTNRVSRFAGNTAAKQSRSFGGQRQNTYSNNVNQSRSYSAPARSAGSFGGSRGGGSFGGSRGGGGSFGGSRGGGGSFGGRR